MQRYARQTEESVIATDGRSGLDSTLSVTAARSTGPNKKGKLCTSFPRGSAIWINGRDGHIERWARLLVGAPAPRARYPVWEFTAST